MGKGISQSAFVGAIGKPYNNYCGNQITVPQQRSFEKINKCINYKGAEPPTKSFEDDMHLIA
jgi:hypothetical protein